MATLLDEVAFTRCAASAERLSAATGGFCLGIAEGKARPFQTLDKVDGRARDQRDGGWIDEDGDTLAFADDIAVLSGLHQAHLVLVAGTAAGLHGDAQSCDRNLRTGDGGA